MLILKQKINHFLVFSVIFILSGCQSSLGPNVVKETHPGYNSAVASTLDHQMLLNLVRLKYRDEAYFLKVSSITASMSFSGSFGVSSSFDLAPSGNLVKPDFGVGYTDKPTITYQPVQGEDFLENVLSGISLDSIMVLTQSGWSIERVFGLCVERTNGLLNAPTASGPTPLHEPQFKQFKQLLEHKTANISEQRPVTHHECRGLANNQVNTQRDQIKQMTKSIHEKQRVSINGNPFTHCVQIGIGGSELGPKALYLAL